MKQSADAHSPRHNLAPRSGLQGRRHRNADLCQHVQLEMPVPGGSTLPCAKRFIDVCSRLVTGHTGDRTQMLECRRFLPLETPSPKCVVR